MTYIPAVSSKTPNGRAVKVLNVLHDSRFGGPQSRMIQVAPGLRIEGCEPVVAMPMGDDRTFSSMLSSLAIPYRQFNLVRMRRSLSLLDHWDYLKLFWPNVRLLRKMIREAEIDVVHVNGIMHLQGALAARIEKVPLVWHLNEIASPRLLQVTCRPLVRRWASVVAVSSESVRRHYFGSGERDSAVQRRVHLLYPPVDSDRFSDVAGRDSVVREELGIARSVPVIGTVAHLNPFKGLEFLIGAMPMIKDAFPSAKLLIVGRELETQRGYVAALRRLALTSGCAEDILFVGARMDVPSMLGAMSVYVQASLSESFGMATAEASAAGLPVVATDVGGTREVVASGITGLLVEPGSARAIAEGVTSLLADEQAAREMGVRGIAQTRALFSVERCVEAHIAAYGAALAGALAAETRLGKGWRRTARSASRSRGERLLRRRGGRAASG